MLSAFFLLTGVSLITVKLLTFPLFNVCFVIIQLFFEKKKLNFTILNEYSKTLK